MQAVDLDRRRTENAGKTAAGVNIDFMGAGISRDGDVVVHALANFRRHILDERPSQRHIDDLMPAADAQHRNIVIHRPAGDLNFGAVTRVINVVGQGVHLCAVQVRANITPTRQENGIETLVNSTQRLVMNAYRDENR